MHVVMSAFIYLFINAEFLCSRSSIFLVEQIYDIKEKMKEKITLLEWNLLS